MVCPSCGTENPEGAKFCTGCGASLQRVCPSCGTSNGAGARFCGECGTPLVGGAAAPALAAGELPAAPAPDAYTSERRLVSILFADLVGFTTLSESRDAEEVRELLSRYFETCRRLIGLYGGIVEKFIGDAVMAVWGTPTATEDDAERAVRAALDLVAAVSAVGDVLGAPELGARAGVLTGEAAVTLGAVGEGMVAGDLVNTASRVQAVAEPGSVYVGEATRRASERAIVYEDAGTHSLKGKEGSLPLWRALRVVSGVRGQLKSEGLEAPFVGRERELRQIKERFHSCSQDRKAHLVSVTGVAGIGKSRLSWEFFKYFDGIVERVWWHRGRCLAYGEGVSYWALAEMVRSRCRVAEDEEPGSALAKLQATLAEHVPDEDERRFVEPRLARLLALGDLESADRQDLFAAWRLFFERLADSNPVLLVFEDVQWADGGLLDFVEYLLEWSRNHPILVVTLARPELLDRRPTWGAGQRNFSSLHLEPLPEEAMRKLLTGLVPGLPEELTSKILARAEGIPLYAMETVRMLLDRGLLVEEGAVYGVVGEIGALEVPETLHALIAARLDGLTEQERRVVQDAAVLGETFTARALAGLSGLPEAELGPLLASLVRKEVLSLQVDPRSPEHGQYGFLQDLVRRVAYGTLPRRERRERHLAAADQLAQALGDDEAAELIASHLLDAYRAVPDADDAPELKQRAAAALVGAGERAASLAAAADAQRYFEQASELSDDPLVEAELAGRAGEMAWRADRPAEARALLERARGAHAERGDVRAAARVDALLADIDFDEGQLKRAVARLEPALESLGTEELDADQAELAGQLGRFLVLSGEYDRAAPQLERALGLAEALQLPETLSQALNSKATLVYRHGRRYEAELLLVGALELALAHDLHGAALRAYNNLTVDLWALDRWQEANEMTERALELARRVGDRRWEANFLGGTIYGLSMLGDWDEALARAAEVEEQAASGFAQITTLGAIPIYVGRGELDKARALLARHEPGSRVENPDFVAWYGMLEALLLRAEGRPREAFAAIEGALAVTLETGAGPRDFVFVEALEDAAALDDDALRRQLATLDELPPGELMPWVRSQHARFRARLDSAEAETLLETAERILRELGAPFELAVLLLEQAERLVDLGRAGEAEPLLAEATETFTRLRAAPWIERASRVATAIRVPDAVGAG